MDSPRPRPNDLVQKNPSGLSSPAVQSHLLVRGLNWLGDAVMSLPALAALREAFPGIRISVAAPEKLTELYAMGEGVDAVIPLGNKPGLLVTARRLREAGADTALVLPNSPRSALEAWCAGIPRRVGIRRLWRNLLLTDAVAPRDEERRMVKLSASEIERLLGGNYALVARRGKSSCVSLPAFGGCPGSRW